MFNHSAHHPTNTMIDPGPQPVAGPTTKPRRAIASVTVALLGFLAVAVAAPSLASPASAAIVVTRPWFEHGSAEFGPGGLSNVKSTVAHMGKVVDPGLGELTTANGDTVTYAHGVDDPDPSSVVCAAAAHVYLKKHPDGFLFPVRFTWTITGGSGRFSGASGGGTTEACVVVNPDGSGFYAYAGRGTIAY